ncbi:MAG: 2-oxo acid dehydrogenase subunit E2, partial [Bacteroidetes bacterium]|nr:2-oxo acid dehydrogenase subunit E2 [Bacteroidota bacterium]
MGEFCMPSLGADMEAGTLREWLVKPGDPVKRGDIIAIVETQKGLIDIEVFEEGTIDKLIIEEDEKVPVGTVMALIASTKGMPAAANEIAVKPAGTTEVTRIRASPLAKKIAAKEGIGLAGIKGSGEGGTITREDIEKVISQKASGSGGGKAIGKAEESPAGTEGVRMAVAAAMSRSNREIPHYYLAKKVDMSRAIAWLTEANKQKNVRQRLLPVVILVKAVAKALVEVPELNGYWDNGL